MGNQDAQSSLTSMTSGSHPSRTKSETEENVEPVSSFSGSLPVVQPFIHADFPVSKHFVENEGDSSIIMSVCKWVMALYDTIAKCSLRKNTLGSTFTAVGGTHKTLSLPPISPFFIHNASTDLDSTNLLEREDIISMERGLESFIKHTQGKMKRQDD